MDEWSTQIKKGLLEFIVLGILEKKKIYGRDLVNLLNNFGIKTGEGTIYPLLAKLKNKGCVTSILEESTEGAARKYYNITELGRSYFKSIKIYWIELNKNIYKLIKV